MKESNGFGDAMTAELLESVEARLYVDFFDAVPPELASREGLGLHRYGGAFYLTASGHDHPMLNRVMGVGLGDGSARDAAVAVLDRAAEHYREAGVRRWMVQLLPHVESEAFRVAASARRDRAARGGPSISPLPTSTFPPERTCGS